MLPRRWRSKVFAAASIQAAPAAILSGILEVILAIVALVVWYSVYVTLLSGAVAHSTSPDAGSNRIGMFAYVWFWLNPITWVLAYSALEGAVRFLAALSTGEPYGIAPLWIVECLSTFAGTRRRRAQPILPLVADEISPGDASCDAKIASCRPKSDWKYPFTIRYAGAYFQVIANMDLGAGPRPHVYSLRRLPAGEIAAGLKDYDPADVLTPIARLKPTGGF